LVIAALSGHPRTRAIVFAPDLSAGGLVVIFFGCRWNLQKSS
jgi:hypothetical protein